MRNQSVSGVFHVQVQTLTAQLQEVREEVQKQKFEDNAALKKIQEVADRHREQVFELEVSFIREGGCSGAPCPTPELPIRSCI